MLSHQIHQFVRVLAGRGHPHGSRPVVVHVGEAENEKRIVKKSFPVLIKMCLPVAQALNLVCVQACARFPEDKTKRFQ